MRKFMLTASALVLAVSSAGAFAEQGRGNGGQGKGGGPSAQSPGQARQNQGRGGGPQARPQRPGGPQARQEQQRGGGGNGRGAEQRAERRAQAPVRVERGNNRGERRAPGAEARGNGRGNGGGSDRVIVQGRPDNRPGNGRARLTERRPVRIDNGGAVQRIRWDRQRGLVDGCPPGLARRNNGCLPPGQERQLVRGWADPWYAYGRGNDPYIYDSGYLYRLRPDGYVLGYTPLLGGALWPGLAWPSSYQSYDVPDYYVDYYGLEDDYDYRFADGVLYGVDPETQAIGAIAALLTGDDWGIGRPMPAGYDVYNVPYDYRDRYADSADSWYRYSDGYVYQVDPTTRLVQAVIQLIS